MNGAIRRAGFTIVELLIVIVVIGILAAVIMVAFSGARERAANSKIHSDLRSLQKAIESYRAATGTYPNTGGSWSYSSSTPTSYVPGLTAEFNTPLPQMTKGTPTGSDCYIYRSNAAGTEYKVMRLDQTPTVSASEQATVPDSMKDGTWASYQDRYGYWSPGGSGL